MPSSQLRPATVGVSEFSALLSRGLASAERTVVDLATLEQTGDLGAGRAQPGDLLVEAFDHRSQARSLVFAIRLALIEQREKVDHFGKREPQGLSGLDEPDSLDGRWCVGSIPRGASRW